MNSSDSNSINNSNQSNITGETSFESINLSRAASFRPIQKDFDMGRLTNEYTSNSNKEWWQASWTGVNKDGGANLAYVIFFLMGVGNLLPWNAFITASKYFSDRFCNTEFSDQFESFFSLSATGAQCFVLFFVVKYQKDMSWNHQVVYPLLVNAFCFSLTTLFVVVTMTGNALFGITLFLVLITGCMSAIQGGGIIALASYFPPIYINAIMTGQALAGLIISSSALITTASDPGSSTSCDDDPLTEDDGDCAYDDTSYSALSYFILATFTLLVCCYLFTILMALPITQECLFQRRTTIASMREIRNSHNLGITSSSSSSRSTSKASFDINNSVNTTDLDISNNNTMNKGGDIDNDFRGSNNIDNIVSIPSTLTAPLYTSADSKGLLNSNDSDSSNDNNDNSNPMHDTSNSIGNSIPGSRNDFLSNELPIDISHTSAHLNVPPASLSKSVTNSDDSQTPPFPTYNNNNNERTTSRSRISSAIKLKGGFSLGMMKETAKEILIPALSVYNVFLVSIGIFPAIVSSLQSTSYCDSSSNAFNNELFTPFMFFLFNLGDVTGRYLADFYTLFSSTNVWIPSLMRWIFVPLLLHCNLEDGTQDVWFKNDAAPIIIVLFLGFTNGYVASSCMMLGPAMVSDDKASLAGTIMLYALTLGLMSGALTSFAWVDFAT